MPTWYLVLELTASVFSPLPRQQPIVGPVTEAQCEQAMAAMSSLPQVISATCRKAVAMTTKSDGAIAYAYPVFEGDGFVPVGNVK
jgi:hypothetical protein